VSGVGFIYWNPPVDESHGTLADANEVLMAVSAELIISPPLRFADDRRARVVVPGCSKEEASSVLDLVAPDWRRCGIDVGT
jgi:hypothetical protein